MIKKDDFLDAVGNLDSEIVDQYLDMHQALLEKKQAKTSVKQTSGQSRNRLHTLLPVAAVLLVLSVLTVSLLLPMNRKTPPLPPVDKTESTEIESREESTDFEETSAETEQTSPIYQDSHLTPDGRLAYWQSINAVVVEWGKITDKRCKTSDHLIVIDEEHPAPSLFPLDEDEFLYITYVGVELKTIEPYWETMDDSITSWDEVLAKKYVWIPEDYLDVIQEGGRAVLFLSFMEWSPEIRVLGNGYKLFGEVYLTHRLWPITEDDIIQIPSFCEGVYAPSCEFLDMPHSRMYNLYSRWDFAFDKANRELPMYVNIRDGMTLEEWNYYLDCILYEYNYENFK